MARVRVEYPGVGAAPSPGDNDYYGNSGVAEMAKVECGCPELDGDAWCETCCPLGPFQAIVDAWAPAHDRVMIQPVSHFPEVIRIQVEEALAESPKSLRQVNEIIDIISVALNWLRWTGLDDAAIADFVRSRAQNRYFDPDAIFEKYKGLMPEGTIV